MHLNETFNNIYNENAINKKIRSVNFSKNIYFDTEEGVNDKIEIKGTEVLTGEELYKITLNGSNSVSKEYVHNGYNNSRTILTGLQETYGSTSEYDSVKVDKNELGSTEFKVNYKNETLTITSSSQNGDYSNSLVLQGDTTIGPTPPGGSSSSGYIEYATPGTYFFTVPEGITSIYVTGCGGGGGGNLSITSEDNAPPSGGSGGCGGEAVIFEEVKVTEGEEITVVVGKGGKGGYKTEYVFSAPENGGLSSVKDLILSGGSAGAEETKPEVKRGGGAGAYHIKKGNTEYSVIPARPGITGKYGKVNYNNPSFNTVSGSILLIINGLPGGGSLGDGGDAGVSYLFAGANCLAHGGDGVRGGGGGGSNSSIKDGYTSSSYETALLRGGTGGDGYIKIYWNGEL